MTDNQQNAILLPGVYSANYRSPSTMDHVVRNQRQMPTHKHYATQWNPVASHGYNTALFVHIWPLQIFLASKTKQNPTIPTFPRLLADWFTVTLAPGTFSFSILFIRGRCVYGQLVAHLEGLAHRPDDPHRLGLQQQMCL